jgi:hypothetical protein
MARLGLLAIGLGLAGCHGPLAPADSAQGEAAVKKAFEAWRAGASQESLQKGSPPLYLNDAELAAGNKLLAFEIVEPLTPLGRQLRCTVKLSLENPRSGARYEKRIGYQVETHPVLVIAREGL